MHDCKVLGHVTTSDSPECLVCDHVVLQGEQVMVHIDRGLGELTDPRDIADTTEWGHAA